MVSVGLGDIITMAIVVVLGRAKEPSMETVQCPGGARIGIFVDDCFCAGRSHWVSVPIVWAFKHLVGGLVGMQAGAPMEIYRVLDLGGKLVPQLDWEVGIGCS
jgi:hypothetical protein